MRARREPVRIAPSRRPPPSRIAPRSRGAARCPALPEVPGAASRPAPHGADPAHCATPSPGNRLSTPVIAGPRMQAPSSSYAGGVPSSWIARACGSSSIIRSRPFGERLERGALGKRAVAPSSNRFSRRAPAHRPSGPCVVTPAGSDESCSARRTGLYQATLCAARRDRSPASARALALQRPGAPSASGPRGNDVGDVRVDEFAQVARGELNACAQIA
jgi:hypothetical protein